MKKLRMCLPQRRSFRSWLGSARLPAKTKSSPGLKSAQSSPECSSRGRRCDPQIPELGDSLCLRLNHNIICWYRYAPFETIRNKFQDDLRIQRAFNHFVNHKVAKSSAGRWDYRRTALLDPFQEQFARCQRFTIERPGYLDHAGRHRKRAVLACICCKFVDRESDRLGGFRCNDNVGSGKFDSRALNVCERHKLLPHQVCKGSSLPTVPNQHIV